jgi:hypothetical protein
MLLDGTYAMEIQIGKTLFKDIFVLKGSASSIDLNFFNGQIEGHITVPGVFSSPLSGTALCDSDEKKCELKFEIVAHEKGQDFKVFYHAQIPEMAFNAIRAGELQPILQGVARLENGEILGDFKAHRYES